MESRIYCTCSNTLKIGNEAVVEGVISRHAAAGRHLSPETVADEAFIDYNGPAPTNADSILSDVLDMYFKDNKHHISQTSYGRLTSR